MVFWCVKPATRLLALEPPRRGSGAEQGKLLFVFGSHLVGARKRSAVGCCLFWFLQPDGMGTPFLVLVPWLGSPEWA